MIVVGQNILLHTVNVMFVHSLHIYVFCFSGSESVGLFVIICWYRYCRCSRSSHQEEEVGIPLTDLTPPFIFVPFLARIWIYNVICSGSFLCSVSNVIKSMIGTSLPPVVCRRAEVLFTLFVFVYVIGTSNTYHVVCFALFVFILCFVCPVLPVSQDCPLCVLWRLFTH